MGARRRRPARSDEDVPLEVARLACATGAAPIEALIAALAALPEDSVRRTLAALGDRATALNRLAADGAPDVARRPAALPEALELQPELARVRPDLRDHELRGKLLFRDLVGRRSFFQVAAWAIAGIDLGRRDALLLEQLGVNTQLLDPHIWPLAVARRVAAGGAPLARVMAGASAAMFTPNITAEPVASFMRFLGEARTAVHGGTPLDAFVRRELRRGRRIAGFGRPVLGPDERVPHGLRLLKRYGRDSGAGVRLARRLERALRRVKPLALNSAGLQGAVMDDLGFSPDAAAAFCALYFVVPILSHYAFVREHRARVGLP